LWSDGRDISRGTRTSRGRLVRIDVIAT
jgi:hypothetical protein